MCAGPPLWRDRGDPAERPGVRTPGRSSTRGRGQARRGSRRPRRLQPDDPGVAIAEPGRECLRLPAAHRLRGVRAPAGRDPLAPPVHGAAQGLGHLDPVADVAASEQPRLDQGVKMILGEPDGDELLRLLHRDDPAPQRLRQRQGRACPCRVPLQRGSRRLASHQRQVQPPELAPQGEKLRSCPGHEPLGKRSRRRQGAFTLRTQRTGTLRQGRFLVQIPARVDFAASLRIRIIKGPGGDDRIVVL